MVSPSSSFQRLGMGSTSRGSPRHLSFSHGRDVEPQQPRIHSQRQRQEPAQHQEHTELNFAGPGQDGSGDVQELGGLPARRAAT